MFLDHKYLVEIKWVTQLQVVVTDFDPDGPVFHVVLGVFSMLYLFLSLF